MMKKTALVYAECCRGYCCRGYAAGPIAAEAMLQRLLKIKRTEK